MTLQDTFENTFRQRLLDLIYGQWGTLGAPFSDRGPQDGNEVIDPEALLWCSLEFLPTEPRLSEAVLEWLGTNEDYLVRQRVYKIRNRNDPRAIIWQALDHRPRTPKNELEPPSEPCHGLISPTEVAEFSRSIEERKSSGRHVRSRLGRIGTGSATLLLKARDLLGQDIRHFLLVYLLANPHGGKLRDIQAWSGHAYRSLSAAADRWETANVVTLESGYCRLTASEPFRALLQIRSAKIVLVNWLTVFDISVRFLRDLAKARQKGFDEKSTITRALQREAAEQLKSSLPNSEKALDSSVGHLLRCFPQGE
jgi:hypothetical protein